jgi:hypothetical protein
MKGEMLLPLALQVWALVLLHLVVLLAAVAVKAVQEWARAQRLRAVLLVAVVEVVIEVARAIAIRETQVEGVEEQMQTVVAVVVGEAAVVEAA